MDLGLTGRSAIVTGGTRGIGFEIAKCLAAEGCTVAVCGRNSSDLDLAMADLCRAGSTAVPGCLDVTDTEALGRWVNAVASSVGRLDIVVSNVSAQSPDWGRAYATDIVACIALVDFALPHLKNSDAASIVGIASQAALLSVPSYKAYSSMKAALISYLSSLSRELAPLGIRVNSVSPGEIEFSDGFWDRIKREDPELYARTLASRPVGRFGAPEEVARAVTFVASPAASYISGANLLVDFAGREHVQF